METLVAAAIAFVVGWQLLQLTHAAVLAAAHLDQRVRARSAAGALEERLAADAAGAWSAFVPSADVLGHPNEDGHEIDFVTEDAAHRSFWWAYAYDAAAGRVTHYTYAPGRAAVAGETYDGIDAFAVREHSIADLAKPGSEIYDALFAADALVPVDVPYGWNPAATGGNHLVHVRLRGGNAVADTVLASADAPTHFTVVVRYTPAPAP
ncbi:MAG TPA: hypothetical protein VJP76_07980 [Candidatus Tumulicola sp.]|nr:hypothetical protein [Candidatus Tumulicola sp.]